MRRRPSLVQGGVDQDRHPVRQLAPHLDLQLLHALDDRVERFGLFGGGLVLPAPDVPHQAAVASAFARAGLTPRESEVALLALKGLSSPEIAQVLSMSDKTVRQHLSRVYEKHGVSGRGELVHLLFPI